jgi:O-antigen/teichoic acid export membrane protein
MGIIQKQSIQSTIITMVGFAIGAFNMIIFAPKVLTAEELGLTRIITDAGLTLATMCTLGCIPIINKFFPFYKSYLKPLQNDLPFLSLVVCLTGFIVMCIAGYAARDIIVLKFSERSPLFVQYSYLVYPFAFFMLLFIWLESFSWSLRKSVVSNTLKETVPRLIFTLLLLCTILKVLDLDDFIVSFSFIYIIPVLCLFIYLWRTGEFRFAARLSSVTVRLKGRMINFAFFVFGAQVLNLISRTIDTFILSAKSSRGLSDAAVFTIATYVVAVMEVPQRSITSITVPILAESWKNKDLNNISNIYSKSVTTLLTTGLFIFGLIWLNIHHLGAYLGRDFTGIEAIVLFMGVGKLIDLGTGANAQIIQTSNFWKVDFTTNVVYTVVALPLNYILISRYGLMGAAYSSLIAITFYNVLRFGFLWFKFKLQPYSFKSLVALMIGVACTFLVYLVPQHPNLVVDLLIRSFSFCTLFLAATYLARVSEEINALLTNIFLRLRGNSSTKKS